MGLSQARTCITLVRYAKYLGNFAANYVNVRIFLHQILPGLGKLDLIILLIACLSDNSRKPSYFFNSISAWLIHLINPSSMYNKINPIRVS